MGVKSQRGLFDWIVQRLSAVLIGTYALFLVIYLFAHQPLHYIEWNALFSHMLMKTATVLVLVAILWHAWIGLWTVFTDYVKNNAVRWVLEIVVALWLLGILAWCLRIVGV